MGEYEDVVERVRDGTASETDAEVLEKFSASALRKKAQERDEYERRAQDAEKKLKDQLILPKKEAAFAQAGVDFTQLRPAEREAIAALDVEEAGITEEWTAEQVKRYGFPISPEAGMTAGGEPPNAAAVVAAATSAPAGGGSAGGSITPATVAEWGMDKKTRFMDKHPDAWEALKRGETVTGVAFS